MRIARPQCPEQNSVISGTPRASEARKDGSSVHHSGEFGKSFGTIESSAETSSRLCSSMSSTVFRSFADTREVVQHPDGEFSRHLARLAEVAQVKLAVGQSGITVD